MQIFFREPVAWFCPILLYPPQSMYLPYTFESLPGSSIEGLIVQSLVKRKLVKLFCRFCVSKQHQLTTVSCITSNRSSFLYCKHQEKNDSILRLVKHIFWTVLPKSLHQEGQLCHWSQLCIISFRNGVQLTGT